MLEIIASGVCFGFLGLFGKFLLRDGVLPGELLTLRFLAAALIMFFVLLIRQPSKLRYSKDQILSCALLGICGYAVFAFCFFSALQGLSASLTVLLLYTYPAVVALGAWAFFGEKIPREHLLAFPLAGLGLLGLVWGEFSIQSLGALAFGIGASLVYALYILLSSRLLRNLDPMVSAPGIQLFAGLTLGILYLRSPTRAWAILEADWHLILGIAVISTALAMSLFLAGLQKLQSWEVSLLSTTEPLMGVALGALILNEALRPVQILGAGAIILSLCWVSLPTRSKTLTRSSAQAS